MQEEKLRAQLRKTVSAFKATSDFEPRTETNDPALEQWLHDMNEITRARVDAMLQVEGHILIPDPDILDECVARTSAEVFTQGRVLARMRKKELQAKREIKRVEAVVWLEIIQLYKEADAKLPSIEDRKAERDVDQRVQKAYADYFEIVEHTLAVEALVDALKLKSSFLPGLQGQQNNMQRYG